MKLENVGNAFLIPKKQKFLGGWGLGVGMPPVPSAARAFGAPSTFSTVRILRKMHTTPLPTNRVNKERRPRRTLGKSNRKAKSAQNHEIPPQS